MIAGNKKMPNKAYCKQCDASHSRPVGKKCERQKKVQEATSEVEGEKGSQMDQVLALLAKIDAKQSEVEERLVQLEANSFTHSSPKASQERSVIEDEESIITQYSKDGIVPTIASLKSAQNLQAQVAARVKELQEASKCKGNIVSFTPGPSTKLKSGRFRGSEALVTKQILWPQELCYNGPARKLVSYDDLSPQQFVVGYLRSFQLEKSPAIKEAMMEYVIKLFQTSLDTTWDIARGANAVVYQSLEQDRLQWTDTSEVDKLLSLYTQRVNVSEASRSFNSTRKVTCTHYNAGRCIKEGDHVREGTTYRHICSHCFRTVKRAYNHPEAECNRKREADNRQERI